VNRWKPGRSKASSRSSFRRHKSNQGLCSPTVWCCRCWTADGANACVPPIHVSSACAVSYTALNTAAHCPGRADGMHGPYKGSDMCGQMFGCSWSSVEGDCLNTYFAMQGLRILLTPTAPFKQLVAWIPCYEARNTAHGSRVHTFLSLSREPAASSRETKKTSPIRGLVQLD
jgi:hypothetical protein